MEQHQVDITWKFKDKRISNKLFFYVVKSQANIEIIISSTTLYHKYYVICLWEKELQNEV